MPTLRILHGAGQAYEIDCQTAAKYTGTARDALERLISEEIKDPALLRTLQDPRVALDQFNDSEGGPKERPLSPLEDWAHIVSQLQETDIEIGIAKSHAGGTGTAFKVECILNFGPSSAG